MIKVKHSVGSKKPTLKDFPSWEEAIKYCLMLNCEMFLWFDIREGINFLSYHTNNPTGLQYSTGDLKALFDNVVNSL